MQPVPPTKVPMNQMPKQPLVAAGAGAIGQSVDNAVAASPKKSPKAVEVQPLTDIFVPLESIKPGRTAPPLNTD